MTTRYKSLFPKRSTSPAAISSWTPLVPIVHLLVLLSRVPVSRRMSATDSSHSVSFCFTMDPITVAMKHP